jgi:stage V sporulation protein B
MQIMDTFLVPGTLQKAGIEAARATDLFGQLSGMAGSIINLPLWLPQSGGGFCSSISEKSSWGRKEVQHF